MPWLSSKFDSKCPECGDDIEVGDRIFYNGKAYCNVCGIDIEREDKKNGRPAHPKPASRR